MLGSRKNCRSSPVDLDFGKDAGERVCGSRSVSVCARGCGSACACMRVRSDLSRPSHTYCSLVLSFAPTVVSLLWDRISLCGSAWPGTQQSSGRHDCAQTVSQYLFPGSLVLVLSRWFQIPAGVGRKSECWVGKEKLGSVFLVLYWLHWWVERQDPTRDCQGGDPTVWPSEKLFWSTVYKKNGLQKISWVTSLFSPPPSLSHDSWKEIGSWESLVLRGQSRDAFIFPQSEIKTRLFVTCWQWSLVGLNRKGRRVP